MQPDEPSEEEKLEQLPEDNQTPFSPADPVRDSAEPDSEEQYQKGSLNDQHPITDDGVEPEAVYESGLADSLNAHEPSSGNAVIGFTPPVNEDSEHDKEN